MPTLVVELGVLHELDGARLARVAADQAAPLELIQVVVDCRARAQANGLADLANAGWVVASLGDVADVVEDLGLPFGQLFGQFRSPGSRFSGRGRDVDAHASTWAPSMQTFVRCLDNRTPVRYCWPRTDVRHQTQRPVVSISSLRSGASAAVPLGARAGGGPGGDGRPQPGRPGRRGRGDGRGAAWGHALDDHSGSPRSMQRSSEIVMSTL